MTRGFQAVVSNFELFCLSVGREIVVSTFYVFYLSRSLSECDKIDHMITYISQNEVGLLDIQTQILTTGIRSGGERTRDSIGYRYHDGGVGTYSFFCKIITNAHTRLHSHIDVWCRDVIEKGQWCENVYYCFRSQNERVFRSNSEERSVEKVRSNTIRTSHPEIKHFHTNRLSDRTDSLNDLKQYLDEAILEIETETRTSIL